MRQTSAGLLLGAALLVATGCGLLDTNQPNIIDPGNLDNPEGAQTRRIGAIADFTFAQDGDGTQFEDGHILLSGLMADEFVLSTTPPTEQEIDQRRVFDNNSTLSDLFLNLQRARAATEGAAAALEQYSVDPAAEPGIAEMSSLAGYTYLYFGESFCSGVPFSTISADSLVFGEGQTTTEMFTTGLARFDAALAHPGLSADDGTVSNLAAIGRARALLDLGQFSDAAAAASVVPTEYQYVTEHSDSPQRLNNAIWAYSTGFLWSVSDEEGGVGLPYRSAEDSRVEFQDEEDVGLDGSTDQFTLLKYPDASASVVVADGIEARLIEAEALLHPNSFAGVTQALNDIRATFGLDDLPNAGNRDEAIDQLFSERAFWLFATGHRLGDMRRLIRQYGRTEDEVFPSGDYLKGGQYGDDVNMPIPVEEQNNPNASGCIDREA
ncbi:MAG TPA: RagB/SusD family nutrient uptake outer membrane protein [Gemmatimonadales bacterium]|nr:RagB/SusD family nutrient uptake outer membrane protein [Gemmatimonadales bacterium]